MPSGTMHLHRICNVYSILPELEFQLEQKRVKGFKSTILNKKTLLYEWRAIWNMSTVPLKEVLAKNERGYRLTAKNKRFWSLLILLLSVASIRRKLLKTTHTEERSVHTNSESCDIPQSTWSSSFRWHIFY